LAMAKDVLPIWNEEGCRPRKEVLDGTLTDAELALNLSAVAWGRAKPPYDDPISFFESTYLTSNMKVIAENVLGRLSRARPDVNPIIVLDVGLGGGKTHTLVLLYYASKYTNEIGKNFLKLSSLSISPRVVAISGDEYGSEGVKRNNHVVKTLWGDVFWQLGVYEKFSKLDEKGLIPSLDDIRTALEGGPVLILLDELPTYFKLAATHEIEDKAVQFIQRLVIAVSEKEDAVLVVAIAEDVYRSEAEAARRAVSEAAREAMEETRAHVRRKETVLVPVAEEDVVHILKRRLFERIPAELADVVANEYHQMYSRIAVPEGWKSNQYRESISQHYPFHPELIRVLYERLAALDRFHRTRGAIRLLSRVVRRIWDEKEPDTFLIHPFHVDLADSGILDELTTGIGEEKRRNAVEADIWSTKGGAVAQELDEQSSSHWGVPLVRRACNTIYLYSLAAGREGAQGISADALTALCTTPLRPDHYLRLRDTVLTLLIDRFQFIDKRGERFVFVKEPTPSRVIEQLSKDITQDEVLEVMKEKLAEFFSDGADWLSMELFPSNPSDIPDQAYPRIAILNPNMYTIAPGSKKPPDEVAKFILYKDEYSRRLRQYSNSLFLLVASEDRVDQLKVAARKLKAARMVHDDPMRFNIPRDRKTDIEENMTRQEKYLGDQLRATFSNIVYVDRQGPQISTISASGYGSAKGGKDVVAHQLTHAINRVKEESLDPSYVFEYAWPKDFRKISTKSLYEQFHSIPGLIIPATKEHYLDTIKRGLEEGTWALKFGDAIFNHEKMPSTIPIDEKSELCTIEEAEKLRQDLEDLERKPTSESTTQTRPLGYVPELITKLELAEAPLEDLAGDLERKAHRDKFNRVDQLTIRMAESDLMSATILSIKNLLTRLAPDRDVSARLELSIRRPNSPRFSYSLEATKEDFQSEEGKSALDMAWKLKGALDYELALTIGWENGSTPENAAGLLRSIQKGSEGQLVASLEARVRREA